MTAPVAPSVAAIFSDFTEICNDDGFVYKRRKRQTPTEPTPKPIPSTSTSAEKKRRRKESLEKVRKRYRSEMDQWVGVSSALQDLPLLAVPSCQDPDPLPPRPAPEIVSDLSAGVPIDEILLQVEAQEIILDKLLGICEVVEGLCDSREVAASQSLIDLPVWAANPHRRMGAPVWAANPRALVASLGRRICRKAD